MMKKLYACLSVMVLFMGFNTLRAQEVLLVEDFEDGAAVNDFAGWSTNIPPFSVSGQNPCEGLQSMRMNMHSSSGTNPFLAYSSATNVNTFASGSDVKISFNYKILQNNGGSPGAPLPAGTNFGDLELFYSIDGGATWVSYATIDQNDLPTADCSVHTATILGADIPTGSNFGWKVEPNWAAGDYFVYVDDFKAIEQVACIQPVNIEINESSITFEGATVAWEDLNATPAGSYEVAWCLTAGAPDSGNPTCNQMTVTTNSATLTGLADGTVYYVYVRAVCGASSNSEWNGPVSFQTIAIGTDCAVPIEVNADPTTPVVSDLPYSDTSHTDRYGAEEYASSPGANCGGATNLLDGYEVVYHYASLNDDILNIDVTGLTGTNVGVFVYEDCGDIGSFCIGGATTTTGSDLNVNSLFVDAGEDYYIVIASTDASGAPANTDYMLEINGFDCLTWVVPDLPPSGAPIPFVAGAQDLSHFSHTLGGIQPTIDGATLSWYYDNNGAQGALITAPLNTIVIADLDCFWVTQNVGTCEGPALQVCFDEFNCSTDLGGITGTTGDSVCDFGTMSLTATAATTNLYWYANPTGGEPIGAGNQFDTPDLTQTTSYWVSEVFIGQGVIDHQGNPGPTSTTSSGADNEGVTFTTNQPMVIKEVQVFVTSGGNSITLQLEDASGAIIGPEVFAVNGGSTTSPTANTIVLDWMVPTSGTYSLVKTAGAAMLIDSSPTYPYSLGTAGEIISSGSDYYYFFDWTITGPEALCETPRQQVIATVHETKSTTVSADEMIVCLGSTTNLHVTSPNPDYVYTWTWTDATGQSQTATGADIPVTLNQNNTFYVNAFDPNTTCFFDNEISLEVKGAADLGLSPDVALCVGETTKLTAGGVVYDFEQNPTGWTTTNGSTVPSGSTVPISAADWKVVNSPYGSLGIQSNDNSSFYITEASLLGPSATTETILTSPSISMVGVGSASVSFEHFLRYSAEKSAEGEIQVKTPSMTDWVTLETYNQDIGGNDFNVFQNFEAATVDLSPYVGSQLQIRFKFSGGWGWYWAIDDVIITRDFLSGSVSWSPMTDLYFDEAGTIPYTGTSTNEVYFNASQGGTYTYTANLDIVNCSSATADVIVTVYETNPPTTGSATQTFLYGETLGDLQVTGQDLRYYVMDSNGVLDRISVNALLVDGTTYYVSQRLNDCESGTITITVNQICTEPSNLDVIVAAGSGNSSQITATWDAPADLAGVQGYRIVVTDITDPNNLVVVHDDDVPLTRTFDVIDDLPCGSGFTYKVELFSICDSTNGVYGLGGTENFVLECLGTEDFKFEGLSYYPNPTPGMVHFDNPLPIEKIEVYDLTGKKVFVKQANATKVSMNFSSLASGTYLVIINVDGAEKVIQIIRE